MVRPLSIMMGKRSSEPINAILGLHFPSARTIIDPTWGKGVFWRGQEVRLQVTGGDIEPERATHWVGDCRHLPFRDKSFDLGVLDPPFMHDIKPHNGTQLHNYYRGIGRYEVLVELVRQAALELRRVCRSGFVIKCKDSVERARYRAIHVHIIAAVGEPSDLLIFVPTATLQTDPKWKTVRHFRRQESYFLVYKSGRHEG